MSISTDTKPAALEIYDGPTWHDTELANFANAPAEHGPIDFYPVNTPE